MSADTLPFEDWPDGPTVIEVPVTFESALTQFIHRNGWNATQQERMRVELRELLALAGVRKGN